MLWLLLFCIGCLMHALRFCFGLPRYPLQCILIHQTLSLEIAEAVVECGLLLSFGFSTKHARVQPLRILAFALTLAYYTLVTLWSRIWWRERLYHSLIVILYCTCLWWLVILYREAGQIPLAVTFLIACYKTSDLWSVKL